MVIRFGKEEDLMGVKECWLRCFEDDRNFVDWNFNYNYDCKNTVVAADGDKICSAMQLVPYDIKIDEGYYHARYVSGVGTLKEYRNTGLVRKLFDYGEKLIEETNATVSFLIAAVDGMYEKFGYKKIGERCLYKLPEKICTGTKIIKKEDIGEKPYKKSELIKNISEIYKANTKNTVCIKRTDEIWEKIIDELIFVSGGHVIFKDNGYILGYKTKDGYETYEVCGIDTEEYDVIRKEPVMIKTNGEILNKALKGKVFLGNIL